MTFCSWVKTCEIFLLIPLFCSFMVFYKIIMMFKNLFTSTIIEKKFKKLRQEINLTPPLVIEVSIPSQESERSCICMLRVNRFCLFLRIWYLILNYSDKVVFFYVHLIVVRDSSVVRRHYIFLLEPSDVRALCTRKTADLLLQLWVSTFPRFVAIGFYFLSETLI